MSVRLIWVRWIVACWLTLSRRRQKYNNSCPSTTTKLSDLVLILTTAPADERAEAIARALVDERLAACVNVHAPMTSLYWWKGSVERADERQLVIKTTRDRTSQVRARLRELHAYDLPEWIVLPVLESSPEYLEWVRAETASPDTSRTR